MHSMTVAWILAAGLGTRLRPLTAETPKPLLEVCGRPLIVHALQLLRDAGVHEVAVNSHWLHPAIPRGLGSEVDVDGTVMKLRFTQEPTVMGTGGGLLGLRSVLSSGDRVLIANADALIDLDVGALLASAPAPLSTLVLKSVADPKAWGAIGTDDDDRIVSFAGRTRPRGTPTRERMFCGWHCVQPEALDLLPAVHVDTTTSPPTVTGPESCINKEGYPKHIDAGAWLQGFDLDSSGSGFFFDVGNADRLWEANRVMLAGDVALQHLKPFARFVERGPRQFVHPKADVRGTLEGPVVVDEGAVVEAGARVGPFAVVGRDVRVAAAVHMHHAVAQSGAGVDADAAFVHLSRQHRVSFQP